VSEVSSLLSPWRRQLPQNR